MSAYFGFRRRVLGLLGWIPRNRRRRRQWERRRSRYNGLSVEALEARVVLSADALDDESSTDYDTAVTISQSHLLNNDAGTGALAITYFSTTTSQNGSVAYDGNGGYVYTPAAGFAGDDTFTYSIEDEDFTTDSATVTIHVAPRPNGAPTAGDDEFTINLGHNDTEASIDWSQYQPNLTNDSDPDNDPLTVVASDVPSWGWGTLGVGTHVYSYTIDDGHGGQDTGEVRIAVTAPPNGAPTAGDDEFTITIGHNDTQAWVDWSQYQPNLGNDSDPDYDTLSIVSSSVPTGWSNLAIGNHTFSYTVDDGHGAQDSADVVIHVVVPNYAPTGADDSAAGQEDVAVGISGESLVANDSDSDGDSLTVTGVGTASHGTVSFDAQSGQITYTPNANWSGTDSFTYEISDGFGGVAGATVHVTIAAVNDAPVRTAGNPPPISVDEDSANDTAVSLGLSGLDYGPGGGGEESGQMLTYKITAIPSYITLWKADETQVLVNDSLDLVELRGLEYKTVANANGTGKVEWLVEDDAGGTIDGDSQDAFTGSDGTPLASHTMDDGPGWEVVIGAFEIQNNRAVVTNTSSPDQALAVFDAGVSDYTVSATVNIHSGNESAGVAVRYGAGGNTFYFAQVDTGDQNFCIYYFNGSGYQLLTSTGFAGADDTDYVISVNVSGDTITATVDGGNAISVSNCTENLTSTYVGIRADSIAEFDDFSVDGETVVIPNGELAESLAVTVRAVNDAPVRTAGNTAAINVYEDGANDTPVPLGLGGLNYGPGGGADEIGQTLTYKITAIPSFITLWKAGGTQVSVNDSLDIAELRGLEYKTVANANGSGTVEWVVEDTSVAAGGDTFTGSNGTPLESHTMDDGPGWDVVIGAWEIQNNRAVVTSVGSPAGQALAVFDSGGTDYTVSATVNVKPGSESAGVAVRYGSGTGTFYFAQVDTGDQNFCIYYFNGTWYNLLASVGFASSDGVDYDIAVAVSGTTITVTVDGGHQISVSNATHNAGSTLVGLRSDSLAEFDDIEVVGTNGTVATLEESLAVTVGAVNDAPVRTAGNPPPINVEEDSANDTAVSLGLGALDYGPGGGGDEAGQMLTYKITAIPSFITLWKANGTQVLVNDALNLAELRGLTYKTVADAYGSGELTWSVQDNGGTANGGVDTSAVQSLTITVLKGPPELTIDDPLVNESEGFVDVTFRLDRGDHDGVSVDYVTINGSASYPDDYEYFSTWNGSGTIEFAPNDTEKTVRYIIKTDNVAEDDETFVVQASNISGAILADVEGVVTILGDPTASVEGNTVNEAGELIIVNGQSIYTGKVTVTFRLSRSDHTGVTLEFGLFDHTADIGVDYSYVYPYVTFGVDECGVGETEKTVEIDIIDDSWDERPIEIFRVRILDVQSGSAFIEEDFAEVGIRDNDLPGVLVEPILPGFYDEGEELTINGSVIADTTWTEYSYVVYAQNTQVASGTIQQGLSSFSETFTIPDDFPILTIHDAVPITVHVFNGDPQDGPGVGIAVIQVSNISPTISVVGPPAAPASTPTVDVIVFFELTISDPNPDDGIRVRVYDNETLIDTVFIPPFFINNPTFPFLYEYHTPMVTGDRTLTFLVNDDDDLLIVPDNGVSLTITIF